MSGCRGGVRVPCGMMRVFIGELVYGWYLAAETWAAKYCLPFQDLNVTRSKCSGGG